MRGLYPPAPPVLRVGVKAGFDEIGGGGPAEPGVGVAPPEYFDPDASDTFWTMPSGVRSLSDRAVI